MSEIKHSPTEQNQAAKPKLIVVDDDKTVLAAVTRLLAVDFELSSALSGEEALALVEKHPDVAVVLTDQQMGGMTGLALLTKVQDLVPDAARVVFSGNIALAEMANAINSKLIHRFIYKPWDNDYLRVQMLEALATHLGLKERRALEHMSITDPLTQVKNRRYFHDRLASELERSDRHGYPLALVMIDIDHFKNFNDDFGHMAGDTVLREVARHLTAQLRLMDTIARFGGEEFALILPDTTPADAMRVAERVRTTLSQSKFQFEGSNETQVTISLGIACHPQNATTTEGLIAHADAALYQAKRQGRNQSVSAV
jgi:diguanylate cyclase (GGDEF)-like protein